MVITLLRLDYLVYDLGNCVDDTLTQTGLERGVPLSLCESYATGMDRRIAQKLSRQMMEQCSFSALICCFRWPILWLAGSLDSCKKNQRRRHQMIRSCCPD